MFYYVRPQHIIHCITILCTVQCDMSRNFLLSLLFSTNFVVVLNKFGNMQDGVLPLTYTYATLTKFIIIAYRLKVHMWLYIAMLCFRVHLLVRRNNYLLNNVQYVGVNLWRTMEAFSHKL